MNCSPGNIYVSMRRWFQSVSTTVQIHSPLQSSTMQNVLHKDRFRCSHGAIWFRSHAFRYKTRPNYLNFICSQIRTVSCAGISGLMRPVWMQGEIEYKSQLRISNNQVHWNISTWVMTWQSHFSNLRANRRN
jgi:hypothetical protein